MIIAKVILFVLWQIIPVISAALVSQLVLSPNIEEKDYGTEDAKPDQTEA